MNEEYKPWVQWQVGDTVRYISSGGFIHDRMTIDSDYFVYESPDEYETFLVLDDDGDELGVLVGEFKFMKSA